MAKKKEENVVVQEQPVERRKSIRTEDTKKDIMNRLSRIEGQIKGVKNMVGEDRFCDDVLIQLSAVYGSIKSLANAILEDYIYTDVIDELKKDNLDLVKEVVEYFTRFQ